MRKSVWGAIAVVALATGCTPKRVQTAMRTTPSDACQFYPLAVGNKWTYEIRTPSGVEAKDVQVETLRQEGRFFVDNQGGKLECDAFGVRDDKRYLLRDPIQPDTQWSNVVSVSSAEHYRILEVGAHCEAPAGSYEGCVRVEAKNRIDERRTLVNEFTFAPAVGLVRIRMSLLDNDRTIPQQELVLKRAEVKK